MNKISAGSNDAADQRHQCFPIVAGSKYLRPLTDEEFVAACRDSPGEKWRFAICDTSDGQQVAIATSIAAACHSAKKAGIHMYLCH